MTFDGFEQGVLKGEQGVDQPGYGQVDRSIILISHGKDDEAQSFVILSCVWAKCLRIKGRLMCGTGFSAARLALASVQGHGVAVKSIKVRIVPDLLIAVASLSLDRRAIADRNSTPAVIDNIFVL